MREQPTDEMRPGDVPRNHTRPLVSPTGRSQQDVRGFPPPEQPVRENRGADARRPAEATGGRAWTWVLLIVLPVVVIAAAGVLLFLLLSG